MINWITKRGAPALIRNTKGHVRVCYGYTQEGGTREERDGGRGEHTYGSLGVTPS